MNLDVIWSLLAWFIKRTGSFKGKGRLIWFWMAKRPTELKRTRPLPGGGSVLCDLAIPYEAMVWLEQEEQPDLVILQKLLRPGQIFVDCGANIGIWTLVAAAKVAESGKVYAFEPNPLTFQKLQANLSTGSWQNIEARPEALGSEEGTVYLKCEVQHNISQVVLASQADTLVVPQVTLDSSLAKLAVAGIKIDVEGFELKVLKGAAQLLKAQHPWLCVEFNTVLAGVNVLGQWEVHQYLSELGYHARLFKDALADNILPRGWQTTGYCNLFYFAS